MQARLGRLVAALLLSAFVAGSGAAIAHDDHDHQDTASTPAGTPAVSTGTGLVYLSITNTGSEADRLVGARTEVSEATSMHANDGAGDVMQMTEVTGGFPIEPGTTVKLGPGGSHIMLENLTQDLRPGTTYEITLTFERAGDVTLVVTVGAEAPEDVEPVNAGDLEITAAWSLPAPMLGDATPSASPEGTPADHHH
jgi:periplasmic copper chaperone A